jgi:hypothetical protein
MNSTYCFGTLALGRKYTFYARQLALDLRFHAPDVQLLVLTDRCDDFASHENVIAVRHKQESILRCYHDKRCVIDRALTEFEGCVFIDADCRILDRVPEKLTQQLEPGITAPYSESIRAKYASDLEDERQISEQSRMIAAKEWKLVQQAAHSFRVDLDRLTFVRELLFAIVCDGRQHLQFIEHWRRLAHYFELRGLSRGEGISIGMAAQLSGLPIYTETLLPASSFFNEHMVATALRSRRDVSGTLQLCHAQRSLLEAQLKTYEPLARARASLNRLGMLFRWTLAVAGHMWSANERGAPAPHTAAGAHK